MIDPVHRDLQVVGRLKGLVRVILDEKEPPLLSAELMKQLLKPEKYVVRVYCLTGKGLASMDVNMAGQPSNSDPYLKVANTSCDVLSCS
jgi:hypothetical protein